MTPQEFDQREARWATERRECFLKMRKAVENLRHGRKEAVSRYLSDLSRKHGREFANRQLRLLRELVNTWTPKQHWKY